MATNFPDTSIINPATGTAWADGDEFADANSGLVYYWYAPTWKTSFVPNKSSDARYVEVSGDTMTGLLTLPSDPTRALEAATKQYVDTAGGQYLQLDAGTNDQSVVGTGAVDFAGDLTIGTDKITLDATEGTAEFAGDVTMLGSQIKCGNYGTRTTVGAGTNVFSGSKAATLFVKGDAAAASAEAIVVQNGDDPNSDVVISLKYGGDAVFAGTVDVNNGAVVANSAGYLDIYRQGQSGNGSIFRCYGDIGGENKVLTSRLYDGGRLLLGNNLSDADNNLITSSANINLNGDDGTANFFRSVFIGDVFDPNYSEPSQGNFKLQLVGANSLGIGPELNIQNRGQGGDAASIISFTSRRSGVTGYSAVLKADQNGVLSYGAKNPVTNPTDLPDATITLDGRTGTATFAGDVSAGASRMAASGALVLPRADFSVETSMNRTVSGGKYVFISEDSDTNDRIASITTDGTAEFSGYVTAGEYDAANMPTTAGAKLADNGALLVSTLRSGSSTTDVCFRVKNDIDGEVISMLGDGSAVFKKQVRVERGGTGNQYVWLGYKAPDFSAATSWIRNDGAAEFLGTVTAPNVRFNLEPENEANYTVTTEEYEEQELDTPYVPAVDSVVGPRGNVIKKGVPAQEATYKTVTKTREVKTYSGPTLDVKDELQSLRARATQQDEVIAMMTAALKSLGVDTSAFPAPRAATAKTKTTKKK